MKHNNVTDRGMSDAAADELLLEAVRYVLEEMPPAEREPFERRLIDDQSTREAVVEAVALCQAASHACRSAESGGRARGDALPLPAAASALLQPADSQHSARHASGMGRRAAVAAAMALAASIVFAFVLAGVRRDHAPLEHPFVGLPPNETGGVDDRRQLAIAWLNFLPAPDDVEEGTDQDNTDHEAAGGEVGDEPAPAPDEGIALVDPANLTNDWLFEAVATPALDAASGIAPPREG